MTEVLGIAYRDLNIFKAHFSTKGLFFFQITGFSEVFICLTIPGRSCGW